MTTDKSGLEGASVDPTTVDSTEDEGFDFDPTARPLLPITQTDAWVEDQIREERRRRAQLNS